MKVNLERFKYYEVFNEENNKKINCNRYTFNVGSVSVIFENWYLSINLYNNYNIISTCTAITFASNKYLIRTIQREKGD